MYLNTLVFFLLSGITQTGFPPPFAGHSQRQGFCGDFTPLQAPHQQSLLHYSILTHLLDQQVVSYAVAVRSSMYWQPDRMLQRTRNTGI